MISVIGENIKRIREMKNISAYQLSKKAGVGSSTISQIESGKRQTLKGDTLNKIATALGVPSGDLLGDSDTLNFETNEITDILNILDYTPGLTLDDVELADHERQLLNISIKMALSTIRYNRSK